MKPKNKTYQRQIFHFNIKNNTCVYSLVSDKISISLYGKTLVYARMMKSYVFVLMQFNFDNAFLRVMKNVIKKKQTKDYTRFGSG